MKEVSKLSIFLDNEKVIIGGDTKILDNMVINEREKKKESNSVGQRKIDTLEISDLKKLKEEAESFIGRKAYEVGVFLPFLSSTETRIYKYYNDYNEEPVISPSFLIYFSGCNMRCLYCEEFESWNIKKGYFLNPKELVKIIPSKIKTISFIGGNPDHNLDYILDFVIQLKKSEKKAGIVLNSNFLLIKDVIPIYKKFIDYFVIDFKFGNNKCAKDISGVDNYVKTISENLGLLRGENVIIRHLLIPGHFKCCTFPILRYLYHNYKKEFKINIMEGYVPYGVAKEDVNLNRTLNLSEIKFIREIRKSLEFNYA